MRTQAVFEPMADAIAPREAVREVVTDPYELMRVALAAWACRWRS
jgi:hypothetical protein